MQERHRQALWVVMRENTFPGDLISSMAGMESFQLPKKQTGESKGVDKFGRRAKNLCVISMHFKIHAMRKVLAGQLAGGNNDAPRLAT